MAVTETTAETDGSLTAVTLAETEIDCQPRVEVNEACALKPYRTTHNRRRRVPGITDDTARQAVRRGRRMGSNAVKFRVVYTS